MSNRELKPDASTSKESQETVKKDKKFSKKSDQKEKIKSKEKKENKEPKKEKKNKEAIADIDLFSANDKDSGTKLNENGNLPSPGHDDGSADLVASTTTSTKQKNTKMDKTENVGF